MRLSRVVVLALALQCGIAPFAVAQTKPSTGGAKKAPSTAECVMQLGPFRGKTSAAVKDQDITEYAPLIKTYWSKGCPADLYEQEIADGDLRKRIDAAAPRSGGKKRKQG